MASRDIVARFEAERQALAIMDHQSIARIFDGGTTDAGQPYFVMELVQGPPITEYCDQQQLATRERLDLFLNVCRAVHHAHQKGVIHRDLKPSNVLVPEIDGAAVPKVIDFGVAKAVGQKLSEQTVYTQFAQLVGTPLYMSPEQAGLGVVDVDTRSDVYSLGVLLYELLTGSTPFDSETLKQAGFDEMRRMIREDERPRPSAMISTLEAQALSTVAERRGCDPRKLSESLQGELDWLVMKTLEKDRNRRYESASALAADVERYLKDEPIAAGPPSTAYRVKKYVQRNKGRLIATALATAVLLIGGGIAMNGQLQRARENREITQDVEQSLAEARTAIETGDLAVAGQRVSEAEKRIAGAREQLQELAGRVNALNTEVSQRRKQLERLELFEQLAREAVDDMTYDQGLGGDVKAREALKLYDVLKDGRWTDRLRESHLTKEQQRRVRETAYHTLLVFADFGIRWDHRKHSRKDDYSPQFSLEVLQTAAKFHDPTRAFYWVRSECYEKLDHKEEAERDRQRYEATPPEIAFDYFLPGHTAGWRGDIEEASRAYKAGLLIEPDHFNSLFYLALRLQNTGNENEAEGYYRACVALQPTHVPSLRNLALVLVVSGEYMGALELITKAIDLEPTTAQYCAHGQILGAKGDFQKALQELDAAIDVVQPDTDPKSIGSAHFYRGHVYSNTGRIAEAIEEFSKAIHLTGHFPEYWPYEARAEQYLRQKEYREALEDLDLAIAKFAPAGYQKLTLKDEAQLHSNRGVIYRKLKNYEHALKDQLRAIDIDPSFGPPYLNAALLLLLVPDPTHQDPTKALDLLDKAHKLEPKSAITLSLLGLAKYRTGDFLEAINSCAQAINNGDDEITGFALLALAMAHAQLGHKEDSIQFYEKAKQRIDAERQNESDGDLSDEFIKGAIEGLLSEAEQLLDKKSEQSMRSVDLKEPNKSEPND
jgi:tetratricopeptide (TPR) repeat protein